MSQEKKVYRGSTPKTISDRMVYYENFRSGFFFIFPLDYEK
jgi:hypothetical protein